MKSAVLCTTSNPLVSAVLKAVMGRIAVCAEAITIGMAMSHGDIQLDTGPGQHAHMG